MNEVHAGEAPKTRKILRGHPKCCRAPGPAHIEGLERWVVGKWRRRRRGSRRRSRSGKGTLFHPDEPKLPLAALVWLWSGALSFRNQTICRLQN